MASTNGSGVAWFRGPDGNAWLVKATLAILRSMLERAVALAAGRVRWTAPLPPKTIER